MIATSTLLLSLVVIPSTIAPASAAEPTLQQIFDDYYGKNKVDTSKETGKQTFPAGIYSFTIIEKFAKNPDTLGWYAKDHLEKRIAILANLELGDTTVVVITKEFGLYSLDHVTGKVWHSQPKFNSDSFDHFRTFAAPGLGSTAIGIEDQLKGGDKDFNDVVVAAKRVAPLP